MHAVQLQRRGRLTAAAVAAALTAAAVVLAVVATASQQHAASPPASAANHARERALGVSTMTGRLSSGSPAPRPASESAMVGPILSRSTPVSLDVPRIGIHHATLVKLGLAKDGSIQVPPVGPNSPAGWFADSPTPGQLGASVIVGHLDSAAAGPAIFYRLGALRPGDIATITRADRTVAVFIVDSVEKYPKSLFPTLTVFGSTDEAALRLITCGGAFDPTLGRYQDNIVVYAHLASSHPRSRHPA